MKKIARMMFVAAMAIATVGFVSCDKEENNVNNSSSQNGSETPTYETLERTEWEGSYSTTTQTQQGTMALTIRWTLDFLANGQASVMMVFESQAFDNTPYDWTSTYSYDAATGKGTITDDNLGTVEFTTDAVNRTMIADLVIYVQHEEGGTEIPYGGTTTLHQTH